MYPQLRAGRKAGAQETSELTPLLHKPAPLTGAPVHPPSPGTAVYDLGQLLDPLTRRFLRYKTGIKIPNRESE